MTLSTGGVFASSGTLNAKTVNFTKTSTVTLSTGGVFSEAPSYVYVIRQVPLTEGARGMPGPEIKAPGGEESPSPTGEQLLDTINRLSKPDQPGQQPKPETPKQEPKLEDP